MAKLFATGRTDLLTNFVSRRNGRKFKAYLVARPDGSISFEFEARKPRAAAASAPAEGREEAAKPAKRRAAAEHEPRTKARTKPRRKAA